MLRRRSMNPINPDARAHRGALRALGALLVLVGGVLTAIGLISFFSAFGSGGPPEHFWCAFLGLPLLGFGVMLLQFGYLGAAMRYVAGESAPVAADTFGYVARQTSGGVENLASAVRRGLAGEGAPAATAPRCSGCGADNDPSARFCDQCGSPMARDVVCGSCQQPNDTDARFCQGCGASLA